MVKDIISIVENSKVMHPIAMAASKDTRYWNDFLQVTEDYKKILSEQEYNDFLIKSRLDCKISMEQYLQFSTEVTVVDFIIRNYNEFKNEPKYNGYKNPECSFKYKERIVNIEVKCPDLTKRIKQESSERVKTFAVERFPNKDDYVQTQKFIELNIADGHHIQTIDRMDNKLMDYLKSAHNKFPDSDPMNFNILVIAVDIIQDMDEWYSYLFGENGVFTDESFIKKDYSKVDAVLLTNVQHGHMGADVDLNINCWHLENYVSVLFLDPRKGNSNGLGEYYRDAAIDLFGGSTSAFLSFQLELDKNNDIRGSEISKLDLDENPKRVLSYGLYNNDKIISLQIISEWIKTIKEKKHV